MPQLNKFIGDPQQSKREKSIYGFFSKILKPRHKRIAGSSDSQETTTIGASEPSIDDAVLKKLNTYIDTIENKGAHNGSANGSALSISNFSPVFETKRQKMYAYKNMYLYPEINKAVNTVVSTAISPDENGELLKLKFKNEEVPTAVQAQMSGIFDYMAHELFDIDNNMSNFFKKFLIEGELYIELVVDDQSKNIVNYHILPGYSVVPIYKDGTNHISGYLQYSDVIINGVDEGQIEAYEEKNGYSGSEYVSMSNQVYGLQTDNKEQQIEFLPNQIAYANFGQYGTSVYDVYGYLETVRKTYNIMSTIDDSLAIYRFVRAPETRLWNVFTKGLPPTQAESYLDSVIAEFRKDYDYNPATGSFSQTGVFNSIIDDYFFAMDEAGNKTTVETLSGAMNLDNLEDAKMAKEKLMAGLQIPRSRWDKEAMKDWTTRNETTTAEEQQFSLFIEDLKRNFKYIFQGPFETLCRANGIAEEYLSKSNYALEFSNRNSWKFWQDIEVWKTKSEAYEALRPQMRSEDVPEGPLAPEFVFRKVFDLSQSDVELNDKLLEEYEEKKSGKSKTEKQENFVVSPDEDFDLEDVIDNESTSYKFGKKYLYGVDEFEDEEIGDNPDMFLDDDGDDEDVESSEYDYGQKYAFGSGEDVEPVETSDFYEYEEPELVDDKYNYGQKFQYGTAVPETEFDNYSYTEDDYFEEDEELAPDSVKFNFNNKYLFGVDED